MSKTITETDANSPQKEKSRLARIANWLAVWAAICLAIFILRFPRIWILTGGSWFNLLMGYLTLWIGGAVLFASFLQLDRIKSEGLKFAAQMLLCLLFTMVVGAVIVFVTL